MVAVAKKSSARMATPIEFRVAPIEHLPFDDGEFDAALSSLMLHHLPDDLKDRGLAEVRRVLKPGGRLVVVDLSTGSRTTTPNSCGREWPQPASGPSSRS
jgi:ubiquinone/menaquinone biosynthesis C-methylase UbiE